MDEVSILNEKGEVNLAGMQIKISDIIGDKIVDQFIASMSPEQMDAINQQLFKEVFEDMERVEFDSNTESYKKIKSVRFKTSTLEKNNSYWGNRTVDTTIYARAKSVITQKYSEMIEQSVDKYLDSEEFKKKASEIAKQIVDYALEGYKKDVEKSVYERLVAPVVAPTYNDVTIRQIIHEEVQHMMNEGRYYN